VLALALVVVGGAVIAAFFWEAPTPSQVRVIGEGIQVYENPECTVPLTELNFGDVRQGEATSTITGYLNNDGNIPLYIAINQTGLNTELTLYEDGTNVVTSSPTKLVLTAGMEESTTTTTLAAQLNSGAQTMDVANTSAFPTSGVVKVDNELVYYGSGGGGGAQLLDLQRGYMGTTPAIHASGATVTLMQTSYILDPAEVVPVSLHLEASNSAGLASYSFTTTFYSQDSPF